MTTPETLACRVPPADEGARLDRFLASAQAGLSRSQLQGLIREGRVRVNGATARASHRLHEGDEVVVDLPAPAPSTLAPEALPLAIVHADASLLVIDKPAGMVVHPGAGVSSGTLVHALLHFDPAIAGVGGAGRPGIVHRLDRETSGLMIVARTQRAYRALVDAMQRRAVARTYTALVWGDPREDEGTIDAPIGRDPRERRRMAVVARGGRPARTHWRVEERFGLAARLQVRLETGRTHQIRVHLARARWPVIGDPTYGGRPKRQLSGRAAERTLAAALLACLGRQALHASELAFPHPVDGTDLRFSSPLPDDMRRALDLLRERRDPLPGRTPHA